MLFSIVGAVVWVKLFDYLARNQVFDQKLSRKLVHITAGPLFVMTWALFSWDYQARLYALVIPALQAVRLMLIGTGVIQSPNTIRAVTREGDRKELLRGPLFYVVVLGAVTAGFWRDSIAGILVIALMCGGDGLADIVGRRFGSVKLPYNKNKSWAGSVAMLAGSLIMASALLLFFGRLGFVTVDLNHSLPIMAAIATVATIVESLPINQVIDDNMSVPVVAAVLGCFFL